MRGKQSQACFIFPRGSFEVLAENCKENKLGLPGDQILLDLMSSGSWSFFFLMNICLSLLIGRLVLLDIPLKSSALWCRPKDCMKYVTLLEFRLWEGGSKKRTQPFKESSVCWNIWKEAGLWQSNQERGINRGKTEWKMKLMWTDAGTGHSSAAPRLWFRLNIHVPWARVLSCAAPRHVPSLSWETRGSAWARAGKAACSCQAVEREAWRQGLQEQLPESHLDCVWDCASVPSPSEVKHLSGKLTCLPWNKL